MNCLTDWNCRLLLRGDPLLGDHAELVRAFFLCVERFGIKRFCMMPTFDPQAESVARFLLRRERMQESLTPLLPSGARLRMGASVLLSPGLHAEQDLHKLTLPASHYLPLDLPIGEWADWLDLEINRLLYRAKKRLLFLSVERYPIFYPKDVLDRLMRIPNAVYQFNYRALADPASVALIRSLLHQGTTVLLGTATEDPYKLGFYEMEHYLTSADASLSRAELSSLLQGAHLFWNA